MLNKDRKLSIRVSTNDLDSMKRKADQAKLSLTEYVTKCCLSKQIVRIEGLDAVLKEQKAIGRNLNQLSVLANMGRLDAVNLTEVLDKFTQVQCSLQEMLERRRWSNGDC